MNNLKSNDSVAIVSGGMDSVTMLHKMINDGKSPIVLSFVYGQKHKKELDCAKYHAELLELDYIVMNIAGISNAFITSSLVSESIDIPSMDEICNNHQPSTYVPNRNMILISLAVALAETSGVNKVYYGAQAQDMYGYWDTTNDFLLAINNLLSLNRKNKIEVKAPFVNKSKAEVLSIGMQLKIDYSKTWSCYEGKEFACGVCPTCVERLIAFRENNMIDPVKYAEEIR